MSDQNRRLIAVLRAGLLVFCLPLAASAQVVNIEAIKEVLPEGVELPAPPASEKGTVVAPPAPVEAARAAAPALNDGFLSLGPAGTKGEVDGPGSQGNGTYEVLKNDPYEIRLQVKTGYVDCLFVLSRDPVTGQDGMRLSGKQWDREKNRWAAEKDVSFAAEVRYDRSEDRGLIRYKKGDKWLEERFWGVDEGTRMVIEFSGGWNHEFKPQERPATPSPAALAAPAPDLKPQ